jgi:integrase/recombinase XerD
MTTKAIYLSFLQTEYINSLREKRRAKVTVDGYGWLIGKWSDRLQEAGWEANPKKWTKATVLWLRDAGIPRREMSVLNNYATYHGNAIIKELDLEWPRDTRQRADWLTPAQAMQALELAEGLERMVIHLELELGLRRVEVIRMKVSGIKLGRLDVLGKGRQGGKPRTLAYHPHTIAELNHYHIIREGEINKARAKNPAVAVPDALLIYERGGELRPYQRTAIDKLVQNVAKKLGVKFTNHTLRRTYGRMLWLAGVPLETIMDLLGHSDTKTTILYLGLNMDDKADAMTKLGQYQAAVTYSKEQNTGKESGQSGISARETIWLTR